MQASNSLDSVFAYTLDLLLWDQLTTLNALISEVPQTPALRSILGPELRGIRNILENEGGLANIPEFCITTHKYSWCLCQGDTEEESTSSS